MHIPEFVAVVGSALEECPNADSSVNLLFLACCQEADSTDFMPLGTFARLLRATGYQRTNRRYGNRFKGLRPKNPEFHDSVWYWN
ncbi:hypothetical protein ACH4VS_02380 [Streptomyces hygroscopicus]|uniref:hypothetical protein n=1 Tax=Streptomyces hygroscopicus TaxID=1912 RepID=UPI00117EAEAF|nr:hypothetical protein [Streptomyces hygroscopicus]